MCQARDLRKFACDYGQWPYQYLYTFEMNPFEIFELKMYINISRFVRSRAIAYITNRPTKKRKNLWEIRVCECMEFFHYEFQ